MGASVLSIGQAKAESRRLHDQLHRQEVGNTFGQLDMFRGFASHAGWVCKLDILRRNMEKNLLSL